MSSLLEVELENKNLKLSLLKKKFEAVPEEVHGDGLKKYAIAYLLYIIGTVIYSSFSKLKVPACFIHLVKDLAKVNDYAWGAGVLACTMKGLSSFNPEKRISFKGNGIFLMVFLITHLPSLATFYEVDKELFPTSFPLAPAWYKLMLKHHMNSTRADPEVFDEVRSELICSSWLVYILIYFVLLIADGGCLPTIYYGWYSQHEKTGTSRLPFGHVRLLRP